MKARKPDYLDELMAGLRRDLAWTRVENARLCTALEEAVEGMEEMLPYVSDYYRDRWKLDKYVTNAKDALK